ncbi:hypothetical protein FO519_003332 [Halicephalobus sp. NKZ332]|nr:hypothetical protein FO519_003332 [Halicephalobus sp. NKZ332]
MSGPVGPSALVTGSNRGLGLAIVKELLKVKGIENIFAGCRDPSQANDLNELAKSHKSVHVVKLDVEKDEDISEVVKYVEKVVDGKGLNVLVNNAAILTQNGADYKNPDRKIMDRHMSVNVVSPVMITSAFLPLLQKDSTADKPSLVVNISSDCGSVTDATNVGAAWGNFAYGMTKAALNQYTRYLSTEVSYNHIVTVVVHPGWLRTDMGGGSAPLSPDDGAKAVVHTMEKLTIKDNGRFMDRNGKSMRF